MEKLGEENIPRPEYPRPQFVRADNWINLNGEWDFQFDDFNIGLRERWYKKQASKKFDQKIMVPFCFQSELSRVNDQEFHDIVWYKKVINLPENFKKKRILLHFGAVDYLCRVYLNGEYIGSHEGGYIGFSLDITDFVEKENYLVIRVEDPSTDNEIPRGKQYWRKENAGIFYSRVTGIWQTVWIDCVDLNFYLRKVKITPDIDNSLINLGCDIYGIGFDDLYIQVSILFENDLITEFETKLNFLGSISKKKRGKNIVKEEVGFYEKIFRYIKNPNQFQLKISIQKEKLELWDVNTPNLYDLHISIYNKKTGEIYDKVKSYFGMRKISISKGIESINGFKTANKVILLNNKPIYQKLFLVQGYWPESLYTAPSDDAIKRDVQIIKDFGFNGIRTHQKAFDPRFLYWCDKMGVLVWSEIGNAFVFSKDSQLRLMNQYIEMIERDYNHPSIITWVILNEGWGVGNADKDKRMVDYIASMCFLIKSIDPTRIIIDNAGWWHTISDVCTKHFYLDTKLLPKNFDEEKSIKSPDPIVPDCYLEPYHYNDEPIVYSEIGGYGLDYYEKGTKDFFYPVFSSPEELLTKITNLLKEFDRRKEWIHGFCYTELYDQFQEINGLLTFDREPKFPPHKLKEKLDTMFY